MNKKEKRDLIFKEFKKGNIKILGCGAYAVPSEFFLYGITPKYVRNVLKKEVKGGINKKDGNKRT